MASVASKKVIALKPENVAQLVFFIRGEKVMFDTDLAMLYGVEPRVLNQAVARNRKRFPADFMFQVSAREYDALTSQIVISDKDDARGAPALRSQIVISKKGRGGRRYRPYAFTEQGVAMLSSVLRSKRAVEVNVAIMRTFVQLRRLMDSNRDLARKIEALEKKYDEQHGVRGRRRGGLHWSHGDATERSGDRESICGGLRGNQRVNHATQKTNRLSSLEIAPFLRQLPSSRSRSRSPIVRSPPSFPD